jgi:hypothetical protein
LAANRHAVVAYWSLGNACITVVLALFLVKERGPVGIAVASIIGDLVCGVFAFPKLAAVFLSVRVSRIYAQVASGLLALVPALIAAWLASFVLKGWYSVGAFAILSGLLAYPMLRLALGAADAHRALDLVMSRLRTAPTSPGAR